MLQNHPVTCKVHSLKLGTQVTERKVSQLIPMGCRLDTPVRKVIVSPKTSSVCFNDTANKFCVISVILFDNSVIISEWIPSKATIFILQANSELGGIWSVGQRIWQRDFPGIYTTINAHQWSETVQPIMEALRGRASLWFKVTLH